MPISEEAFASTHSSDTIALPDGTITGDRLIVCCNETGTTAMTWPSGWTSVIAANGNSGEGTNRTELRYRDVDGTEGFDGTGDTISVTIPGAQKMAWASRVPAGEFDTATAPQAATGTGRTTAPDPPTLTPSWGSAENLWIVLFGGFAVDATGTITTSAYPSGYATNTHGDGTSSGNNRIGHGHASKVATATSDNPGTFTVSVQTSYLVATVAVKPLIPAAPGIIMAPPTGRHRRR